MEARGPTRSVLVFFLFFAFLVGCGVPIRISQDPPVPLDPFMSTKWGDPVEEVKKATERDGNGWFKDSTDNPPFALYAIGSYLDSPAIFTYSFTPKSKRLYRVTVTFDDLRVFGKAKDRITTRYRQPAYSQPDLEHWSLEGGSLIILQKDKTHVQVSFVKGGFFLPNKEERE